MNGCVCQEDLWNLQEMKEEREERPPVGSLLQSKDQDWGIGIRGWEESNYHLLDFLAGVVSGFQGRE